MIKAQELKRILKKVADDTEILVGIPNREIIRVERKFPADKPGTMQLILISKDLSGQ